MSLYREFFNKIENRLGRSTLGLNFAFRLRDFSNAIIYNSMYPKRNTHLDTDIEYNGEKEFLQLAAPHIKTFIDVGANVGNWTSRLLSLTDNNVKGFLYEPSNCAMETLKSRYGNDPRFVLSQVALGETCGMTTFYEEANAGQTSSIVKGVSNIESVPHQVPITTLTQEFEKHQLDYADMVKIDAEGYDGYILDGAGELFMEQRIGIVQFEYNTSWLLAQYTLAGALNLLEKAGYATYQVTKKMMSAYDYERYNEYFNYGIFVGIHPKIDQIGPTKFQG